MLILENLAFVSIKVDNEEVQYANLVEILLTEGGSALPAIQFELSDPTSAFSREDALTEGNTLEVLIGKSIKDNQVFPRKYRIFSIKKTNPAVNSNVIVVGILNSPKFVSKSAIESFKGTSEDVLKKIAGSCGLKFSGPSEFNGRTMNDNQTWLNVCKNRDSFVKDVTNRGWMDDKSGMATTITSYGEMKYRNLIDLINTPIDKINIVLTHNTLPSKESNKKYYIVKEAKDKSTAGFSNTWLNYGSTRLQSMLKGTHDTFEKLKVQMPGKYLPINQEVASEVEKARFEYAPIDCGNVHEKFEGAKYQNIKIGALFSEKVSCLIDSVTEVALFDVVVYRQADADITKPVKNTDVYLVVGKSIVIRSSVHYAERLELERMSLTMRGNTPLQGPSSFASERSMIPNVAINSAVSGLLGNIPGAKAINNMLQNVRNLTNILPALKEGMLSSLGNVSDLSNMMASGANLTEMPITDTVDSLSGCVSQLSNFVSSCSSVNLGTLANMAEMGLPLNVIKSTLSMPNSFIDNIAGQLSVALPLNQGLNTLNQVFNQVKQIPNGLQGLTSEFQQFTNTKTLMDSVLGDVIGQYNAGVEAFNPDYATFDFTDKGLDTYNTFGTGLQTLSPKNFSNLLGKETTKVVGNLPNLIDPKYATNFIPKSLAEQTQLLNSYIENGSAYV